MTEPAARVDGMEPLAGKYRIEHVIGRGGMGIVLRAVHLRLDEPVAIKLMHQEAMAEPSTVERFMREARAASKIKSSHVVRVTDVDILPSGAPYMVMELLDGYTLGDLSRATGPMAPATVAAYLLQACDAVAEAHALGIVHRDLKPSNLFIARRRDGTGLLKVLDFGISKLGGALHQGDITQTDTLLGSPTYMSPEQLMSSRDVDGRSDIWSLGIVLYQCLTGSVPFKADTLPQICVMVLNESPVPPSVRRPDLPGGLSSVVLRCLEKDPGRRFSSAAELAQALAPFATTGPLPMVELPAKPSRAATSGAGLSDTLRIVAELSGARSADEAGPRTPSAAASGSADDGQRSHTQGGWDTANAIALARGPRRRWLLPSAAIALLLGASGGIWWLGRGAPAPTEPAAENAATETPATATAPSVPPAPSATGSAPEAAATSTATAATASSTAAPSRQPTSPRPRPPATVTATAKSDPFGQSRR